MNAARMIAPLLGLLALAGCTYYKAPEGGPTATLIAHRGKVAGLGPQQAYGLVRDETCKEKIGALGMLQVVGSDTFETKIAAGERLYVRALSGGSGIGVYTICSNLFSFVPEAGASYTITQTMANQRCSVVLLDTPTNAAPPSLQYHDPKACR